MPRLIKAQPGPFHFISDFGASRGRGRVFNSGNEVKFGGLRGLKGEKWDYYAFLHIKSEILHIKSGVLHIK
jgi:hypothetical protein